MIENRGRLGCMLDMGCICGGGGGDEGLSEPRTNDLRISLPPK